MQQRNLLITAFLLFPIGVSAQIITDAAKATAARDSLFSQVAVTRQQIEQKARVVVTTASRAGARRITVKSYYTTQVSSNQVSITKFARAWEHKIVHRHNGSSRELFTAYLPSGKKTIQERRHNGEVTWLWLQNYKDVNLLMQPTRELSGSYVDKRYLQWGGRHYMLPTRLPTP